MGGLVGDVAGDGDARPSASVAAAASAPAASRSAQHHAGGAFGGEAPGQGGADAVAAAGHDADRPGELHAVDRSWARELRRDGLACVASTTAMRSGPQGSGMTTGTCTPAST